MITRLGWGKILRWSAYFLSFKSMFTLLIRLMMDEMEVILALRMVTEVNMRMSAVT